MLTRAIVRPPGPSFCAGLTTAYLGTPNYNRALRQHEAYCVALERCGLRLTRLEPDSNYPDSTFVEDTAIVTARCTILTRPGAASRLNEIKSMRTVLTEFFPSIHEIHAPGTLDGGDVCEAGSHFVIGISERTNECGAKQLANLVAQFDYTASIVHIRELAAHTSAGHPEHAPVSILHLKSGLSYLGDNRLLVIDELAGRADFDNYELVRVESSEEYAANCVRANDYVIVAAGHPKLEAKLREIGYETIALEMSEFQKMDGGLSCLSLRF